MLVVGRVTVKLSEFLLHGPHHAGKQPSGDPRREKHSDEDEGAFVPSGREDADGQDRSEVICHQSQLHFPARLPDHGLDDLPRNDHHEGETKPGQKHTRHGRVAKPIAREAFLHHGQHPPEQG